MMKRLAVLTSLLISGAALQAQAADPCLTAPASCATTINTHATATTRLPNTVADVSLGISVTGKDLLSVQHDLAAKSAALLGWLRGQKVERLLTADVTFQPETKTQKNALDKTVGYSGSEQVRFRTTPDRAPELLGAVVDHGATSIEGTDFRPTEAEIEGARRSLAAEATKSALAEADAVAGAAGLHVVAVRTIGVEASNPVFKARGGAMFEMRAMAAAAPVDIEAGDAAFSVSVDVAVAATR